MPSPTDRSRAFRLRKLRDSGRISADQRAWLESYERGLTRTPVKAPVWPASAAQRWPTQPPKEAAPEPVKPATPPSGSAPAPEMRVIDFGTPAPAGAAPPPSGAAPAAPAGVPHAIGATCTIEDCPACKTSSGAKTCGITGRKVYPPMSAIGSRGTAGALIFVIGLVIKLFREDKRLIQPTPQEVDDLAEALREISFRRANWLGAGDDLFAFGWALKGYVSRAIGEPSKLREPLRDVSIEQKPDPEPQSDAPSIDAAA